MESYDFYKAKGWFIGQNKMQDWEAASSNWIRRQNTKVEKNENTKTNLQDGIHVGKKDHKKEKL